MNKKTIILTLTILALIITSAFADQAGNRIYSGLSIDDKITLRDGIRLSRAYCDMCHGKNARGARASDLTDGRWAYGGSDNDIFTSIVEGRSSGRMPPMESRLTPDQAWKIISSLRILEKM
jgi:mono/diheme cytochrome c family protein